MLRRLLPILVSSGFVCSLATAYTDPPNNVVVIVLDDVGIDALSFYADTDCPTATCSPLACSTACSSTPCSTSCDYARTPNLRALAENGIRFTNVRSTPFCSPSRACFQTGRYPFRTGVGSVISNANATDLQDSEVLIPELLKGAFPSGDGLPYACGAFGKWHLTTATTTPDPIDCTDDDCSTASGNEEKPVTNGYDRFYGTVGNHRFSFCWTKILSDAGAPPTTTCVDVMAPPYTTRTWNASVASKDAGEWINDQTTSFFAYVAFNPPHTPLQVPPCSLMSTDTRCELENYSGGPFTPGMVVDDTDPIELRRLVYRAMLEGIDAEIGKLLAYLDDEIGDATLENTMILVIGDNGTPGPQINPPFSDTHGKGTIYDGGIRVPLIVSGPLVPSSPPTGGYVCDELVDGVDIWRTVAEIAELTGGFDDDAVEDYIGPSPGIELDSDSVSFLELILDPSDDGARTDSFSQQFGLNGIPPQCYDLNERCLVRKSAVDGDHYKLIRIQSADTCYRGPCASPPCGGSCSSPSCSAGTYAEQFFNVSDDPDEATDLLAQPGPLPLYQTTLRINMRTAMLTLSGD